MTRRELRIDGQAIEIALTRRGTTVAVQAGDQVMEIEVLRAEPGYLVFKSGARIVRARLSDLGAEHWLVELGSARHRVEPAGDREQAPISPGDGGNLLAPIPGKVVQLEVGVGQMVERDQVLIVLESMKMQTELRAPGGGVIESVAVALGDLVQPGDRLISIAPA